MMVVEPGPAGNAPGELMQPGPGYAEIRELIRQRLAEDALLEPEWLTAYCLVIAAAAHERLPEFIQASSEDMREGFEAVAQDVVANWHDVGAGAARDHATGRGGCRPRGPAECGRRRGEPGRQGTTEIAVQVGAPPGSSGPRLGQGTGTLAGLEVVEDVPDPLPPPRSRWVTRDLS